MRFNKNSLKTVIISDLIIIITIAVIIPNLLNLVNLDLKIKIISNLANILIFLNIITVIIDLIYLILKRENYFYLASLNMALSISIFLLLEYGFVNDYYNLVYVWSYSESNLSLIYKIVAIWAGEAGSIMTWMVFNSIVIFFYRIKNQDKEDSVFIWSSVISMLISISFLVILFSLNPFKVEEPIIYPDGRGLNPILISPFMIWHPFFTFIAYAIFLIPFTINIVETIKPKLSLKNPYQKSFYNFSLKFGWLVITLSISLGAYWAKITSSWGRYWGWDPVEVVSLIPWFFCTAYFHSNIFKVKNAKILKVNAILIFFSIMFATLITRGGGLSSLHAFTGDAGLALWVVVIGISLLILAMYVIYEVLNYLLEEYHKIRNFFDYLSYLILFCLSFVCTFGLIIPPLTNLISNFININTILVGPNFFIISTFILAIILAVSLIFCSLQDIFKVKWITLTMVITFLIQLIVSLVLVVLIDIWINPFMSIYYYALFASLFKLIKRNNLKMGIQRFFRINSKTIIHGGISFILIGTLIDINYGMILDIFYISGFIFLLVGIIPSIFILFFLKKNVT
ncbi:MAG: cytochrome c biogenesis protein CcsA [Promethearchaeota archaeon]